MAPELQMMWDVILLFQAHLRAESAQQVHEEMERRSEYLQIVQYIQLSDTWQEAGGQYDHPGLLAIDEAWNILLIQEFLNFKKRITLYDATRPVLLGGTRAVTSAKDSYWQKSRDLEKKSPEKLLIFSFSIELLFLFSIFKNLKQNSLVKDSKDDDLAFEFIVGFVQIRFNHFSMHQTLSNTVFIDSASIRGKNTLYIVVTIWHTLGAPESRSTRWVHFFCYQNLIFLILGHKNTVGSIFDDPLIITPTL